MGGMPRSTTTTKLSPAYETPIEEWYDPKQPFRTVARLYKPQRGRLIGAAFAYAIKHSPVWIMPVLTAMTIDIVVDKKPLSELWVIAIIMVVVIAQNLPVSVFYIRLLSKSVREVETHLRMSLARRLQELSIGYHRRMSAGVLQAKIVRDVENVVETSRQTMDSSLGAITTLIGALAITAWRTPEFLPVFLLAVPASAFLVVSMRKRMNARNAAFRKQVEAMSARVSEMTHLIPITRAHALERRELDRLDSTLDNVRDAGIRLDIVNGRFGALSWITFQLLSVVCLVGAAFAARQGFFGLTAGDVVMLSTYFMQLTGSVTVLLTLAPMIAKGFESVRSMGEVLVADEVERNAGKQTISEVGGAVRLENADFQYDDAEAAAINNINLDVAPGETIAFVGPSGSGKSTILNMVIGFLAPTGGRILIDGHDMAQLDLRSYRKHLAVVPQESLLFEGTVRDNVTYGTSKLSDEAVYDALKAANALDFVEDMGGINAVIGERGSRLSGGQRQRLAIARALIRNPKVLILDEATSALDSTSEKLVQQALERLMQGRTTLVVAHRLSTIRGADRIAVMRAGSIVEIGSHDQLLQAGGHYSALVQGQ